MVRAKYECDPAVLVGGLVCEARCAKTRKPQCNDWSVMLAQTPADGSATTLEHCILHVDKVSFDQWLRWEGARTDASALGVQRGNGEVVHIRICLLQSALAKVACPTQ